MDKKNIISIDFQGWPVKKLTFREILESLAVLEGDTWMISDKDPRLDLFPTVIHDDGMGYGVGEEFITCVDNEDAYLRLWAEPPMPDIDLWLNSGHSPGARVVPKSVTHPLEGEFWLIDTIFPGGTEARLAHYIGDELIGEEVYKLEDIR